jgi:hypothetical protein
MHRRKVDRITQSWRRLRLFHPHQLLKMMKSICGRASSFSTSSPSASTVVADGRHSLLEVECSGCGTGTAHRSQSIYHHYAAPVFGSAALMSLEQAEPYRSPKDSDDRATVVETGDTRCGCIEQV